MKFYFSGSEAIRPGPLRDWVIYNCPWRLQSCHGNYIRNAEAWLKRAVELGVAGNMDIMLDSGAFTAWSLGHPMTLDDLLPTYERLQQRYSSEFRSIVFINLDMIPGARDRPPTQEEVAEALIHSDRNFNVLKQALSPHSDLVLPVFHQGEQVKQLWSCCDQSNYVCISPRQALSENNRIKFIRRVRSHLHRSRPAVDTHGLATTGGAIIRANEWSTVDSASWVITGGLGNILIPDTSRVYKGQLDMFPTAVSVESPGKQKFDAHVTTRSEADKQRIQYLVDYTAYGISQSKFPLSKDAGEFTLKELSVSHEHRKAFNLISTIRWCSLIEPDEHPDELPILESDEDIL